MRHLGAFADDRLLGLDERTDVDAGRQFRARTHVGERTDGSVRPDHRQLGVGAQHPGILAHFDVDQSGVRPDGRAPGDRGRPFQ